MQGLCELHDLFLVEESKNRWLREVANWCPKDLCEELADTYARLKELFIDFVAAVNDLDQAKGNLLSNTCKASLFQARQVYMQDLDFLRHFDDTEMDQGQINVWRLQLEELGLDPMRVDDPELGRYSYENNLEDDRQLY